MLKLEALTEYYSVGLGKLTPTVLKKCDRSFNANINLIHNKGSKNYVRKYRTIAKLAFFFKFCKLQNRFLV